MRSCFDEALRGEHVAAAPYRSEEHNLRRTTVVVLPSKYELFEGSDKVDISALG